MDPGLVPKARQAQDRAYSYLASAAEHELEEKLQVELFRPQWHLHRQQTRARRGRRPVLQKVMVTFDAITKQTTWKYRPEAKERRRAITFALSLRGHAQQSIRSRPPLIDGMCATAFAAHVQQHVGNGSFGPKLADHVALCQDIARAATALVQARNGSNWLQVRRGILRKAEPQQASSDRWHVCHSLCCPCAAACWQWQLWPKAS